MHSIEWAAGLFEGEGCMTTDKQGLHSIKLSMTDEDVVHKFASMFGLNVNGPYTYNNRPTNKSYWVCKSKSQTKVREIISSMLPYFGNRRAYKALNILDDLELA